MIGDLGDVDQAVHAGDDLGEGAEGHQLDHAHGGGGAHLVGGGKLLPGILAAVLHSQRDLLLLGVEGNDVHADLIANRDDLSGILDAAPGQLGNMDHAVHAADVHESAVAGQGLDDAMILLAFLDLGPGLLGSGLAGLVLHGADGAHHAPPGMVHLGDAQLDLGLQQAGHGRVLGQAGLRGGDENADALDIDHDAALVLLGDGAFHGDALFPGGLDAVPVLHGIQALLRKLHGALHVVDADNEGLDLLAHLDDVLGLDVGIVGQLGDGDVAGMLGAQIHRDLGSADGGDDTRDLIPII